MATPRFVVTPGYGEIARSRYHFSQAVCIGDRVEISGQGGWDADFTFSASTLADEIAQAFVNVELTLTQAGVTWKDVVSVDSLHVPTADDSIGEEHISSMVEQFRKNFRDRAPVWTAFGVKALALPGMHVEIRVTAIMQSSG